MDRSYLLFEKPIEEINEQIQKTQEIGDKGNVDIQSTLNELETKLETTTKSIFKNLSPWQKVQLSRHPDRPYSLDYINALTAIVTACSAITALTPTPKDDKMIGKLYKFLEMFALVIGKAKK